jgi:uncharacterized membrane protein
MFWAFESSRYPLTFLFAVLTLAVKEDAATYIIIFALYLILSRRKPIHGAVLGIFSLVYFVSAMNILENYAEYYARLYANDSPNPAIAGPMINRFDNLIINKEDGLLGAVKTALTNPGYLLTQLFETKDAGWGKIVYVLQLFLPLGFLPFLTYKPSRWLLISPVLLNLLTDYKYQYDIGFQYHFGISAFLIYAALLNLSELKFEGRRFLLSIAAASCCILFSSTILPKTASYTDKWQSNREIYQKMEEILDTIPSDASVCASSSLIAHIADRSEIYALNYHRNEGDVDYLVFDARYSVDENILRAYRNQGYSICENHEDLILIMSKYE